VRYFEVAATSSVQATPGGAAPAPRGVCIRIVIGDGLGQHNWDDPGFKDWGAKWGALMSWLIGLEHFRSSLKIGPGGETGPVNDMVRHASERLGANIMGRRMFEAGERGWPEEAPFHTPVFVLTHNTVSRGCGRAGRRSISSRTVPKRARAGETRGRLQGRADCRRRRRGAAVPEARGRGRA
jgi:hypothetical protein